MSPEEYYYLLNLQTMTMHLIHAPRIAARELLPAPLGRQHASSPIYFERITERLAMSLWLNGYFTHPAAIDSSGSLEVQLRQRRIDRVVTPVDFKYEYQPSWSDNKDICEDCGNEYPLDTRYWHKDRKGRHGLKTQCKYCRNGVESIRIAERRVSLKTAA